MDEKTSPHAGHRKRLLAKLESGTLQEHEYLEGLLFFVLPRVNTNEIAHRLLATFGSVKGILEARIEDLKKVKGIGDNAASFLFLIGKMVQSYHASEDVKIFPRKFELCTFKSYIQSAYANEPLEVLDFYLLKKDGCILRRHRFSSMEVDLVKVKSDEVMKLFIGKDIAGVVMVHNHLSGTCCPSEQDELTTKKIKVLCDFANIHLCDHLIYSPTGIYSFYESRRLDEINQTYSAKVLFAKKKV
jgi:DNA repair protein RadC